MLVAAANRDNQGRVAAITLGVDEAARVALQQLRRLAAVAALDRADELIAIGGRYKQLYDKQYRFEQNLFVNPGEELVGKSVNLASSKL